MVLSGNTNDHSFNLRLFSARCKPYWEKGIKNNYVYYPSNLIGPSDDNPCYQESCGLQHPILCSNSDDSRAWGHLRVAYSTKNYLWVSVKERVNHWFFQSQQLGQIFFGKIMWAAYYFYSFVFSPDIFIMSPVDIFNETVSPLFRHQHSKLPVSSFNPAGWLRNSDLCCVSMEWRKLVWLL